MRTDTRFFGLSIMIMVILLCLIGLSCSKKPAEFTAAPYVFDANRVDMLRAVNGIDLAFAPPLGWKTLDSMGNVYFQQILIHSGLTTKFQFVQALTVVNDSATGNVMYIAVIPGAVGPLDEVAKKFEDYLTDHLEGADIQKFAYRINDLNIHVYAVITPTTVNYKLVGETPSGQKFLSEYIIRAPLFPMLEPTIFSSMASLRSASNE